MADFGVFYAVGFALVIAGIALIVAAIIRASTRQHSEKKTEEGGDGGHVKAAGVIMIGPIPSSSAHIKNLLKPCWLWRLRYQSFS